MQDIVPIEKKPLRDQVMSVVDKNEATCPDDAVKSFKQCASHIQNTIQVEQIIRQNELSYGRFLTNENLELYFDLVRPNDAKDAGYIAKGWEDPGFRLGDVIDFEDQEESEQFRDYIAEISRECANQGIIMHVKEEGHGFIMQLEGLIYSEGFNKDTFNQTLQALMESVESARMLKCIMLGYMDEWDDSWNKLPEVEAKDEDDLQYY